MHAAGFVDEQVSWEEGQRGLRGANQERNNETLHEVFDHIKNNFTVPSQCGCWVSNKYTENKAIEESEVTPE